VDTLSNSPSQSLGLNLENKESAKNTSYGRILALCGAGYHFCFYNVVVPRTSLRATACVLYVLASHRAPMLPLPFSVSCHSNTCSSCLSAQALDCLPSARIVLVSSLFEQVSFSLAAQSRVFAGLIQTLSALFVSGYFTPYLILQNGTRLPQQ
jgi:hypothetical protein